MTAPRVLFLGASGRLGAMVRRHWPKDINPIWQLRGQGDGLCFDPLTDTPDCGPVDVVLGLAGVVQGKGDLALNVDLGLAALRLGRDLGARHVFIASSAAVYGAQGAGRLREDGPLAPASPYGQAKLQMEDAVLAQAGALSVTVLRIGNVAGADALLGGKGAGRVLDQFAGGCGPRRSYIGPRALADMLARLVLLASKGATLPQRLNIALDGPVAMQDLCHAAGLPIAWRPAPADAIQDAVLDVARLAEIIEVAPADAAAIVQDWRADLAKAVQS